MAANKQSEIAETSEFKLKLYQLDKNEFIGSIWLENEEISNSIPTYILFDSSNSMGDASRFVNEIIPLVASKLCYEKLQPIHLITFGTETTHHKLPAEGFKSLKLCTDNATRMAPAIQKLHSLIQNVIPNKPIRVLSISSGQIGDHDEAEMEALGLIRFLDTSNFTINSQAVRMFTSESQPDTKALCCLLQINNTTTSKLIDIGFTDSNEIIATKIAELFRSDNFSRCKTLEMEKPILLKYPWNSKTSLQIILVPGLNIFWLTLKPTGTIQIGNKSIEVIIQDVSLIKFQGLMESKLAYILDHMKILKVIGNDEANKSVVQMLKYFESKETMLAQRRSASPSKKISMLFSASSKHISKFLAVIANENIINSLDSAQMAKYLRGTRRFKNLNVDPVTHGNSRSDSDAQLEIDESRWKQKDEGQIEQEKLREMKEREDWCQQSENIDFPPTLKNQRDIRGENHRENSEYFDYLTSHTSGKQTKRAKIFHSTPITKRLQDIGKKQSKSMECIDSCVVVKNLHEFGSCQEVNLINPENSKPSGLVKQFGIMKNVDSSIDANLRDVNGEQTENLENVNTPPTIMNLQHMCGNSVNATNVRNGGDNQPENVKNTGSSALTCMSENLENLDFSPINDSQQNVGKQLESTDTEAYKSLALVMKNCDPENVKNMPDYRQSKNVNIVTPTAIVKTHLQDLHEKQSEDTKDPNSPTIVKSLPDLSGKQSGKVDNFISRMLASNSKDVAEKQSSNSKNVDPSNGKDLQTEAENQLKDTQSEMMSTALVMKVKDLRETQSKIMKSCDPSIDRIRDETYQQSEIVNILYSPAIVKNHLQDLCEKQSDEKNLNSPTMVRMIEDISSKQSENKKVLDSPAIQNIGKFGGYKSGSLNKSNTPVLTKDFKEVGEEQSTNSKNVVASKANVKNVQSGDTQSEMMNSSNFATVVMDMKNLDSLGIVKNQKHLVNEKILHSLTMVREIQDVGCKQFDNLKSLDSPAIVKYIQDSGGKQSENQENFNSPILAQDCKSVDANQSANVKNIDSSNVAVESLQEESEQQYTQSKIMNSPRFSSLVNGTQNIVEKQSENINNIDSLVNKNVQDVVDMQSEQLKNSSSPEIVDSIKEVNEKDSQNIQNINSSALQDLQDCKKLSEILESLAFSPIIESPRYVDKQSGRMENLKSSALVMRHVNQKESVIMETIDLANDNMRDGEYQKKENDVNQPEYKKGCDNVIEKPSKNNKTATIVKNLRNYDEKQAENMNQHYTNVPVGVDVQSESFENLSSPSIIKNINEVSEKLALITENADINIFKKLRNIGGTQKVHGKGSEDTKSLESPVTINIIQDIVSNQSEKTTNLDCLPFVDDLGEKQLQNVKNNSLVIDTSLGAVSGNQLKRQETSVFKNDLQYKGEKQSDPANEDTLRDVGDAGASGSELITYQPHSSLEMLDPDTAMVDISDQQSVASALDINQYGSKNKTNLQVFDQKHSQSMKNLQPAIVKKQLDVTYTLSANWDRIDASSIVMNLQDVSDEQSKHIENIDLPVMVKKKYWENLKNLDLAERGIAKNVSTFIDISDIESDAFLELTGTTQNLHGSGNDNNINTAEIETPKDRCGTFVIHSKNVDPLEEGFFKERNVGKTNDQSDVVNMPQAKSETKNLLHPLMENNFELQVYPMDEYEFIGKITIEEDNYSNSVELVIILDQSLSMEKATRRLTNEILPLMLSKLADGKSQPVHFITFAMDALHYSVTADEMKLLPIETHYGTNMAPCVQKVHSLFQSFDSKRPIRILSISDGEIRDCQETENAVLALTEFLNASDFSINAQAVRLVTPDCQPDARALCTFLRINNSTTPQLVDIDVRECNETIASIIADLFQSDNFSRSKFLTMENEIILKFPWNSKSSSQIVLLPGLNVFWLNKIPTGEIKIANSLVKMIVQNPLTLSKFQDLIESKLVYIAVYMQILKISDTALAFVTVDQIVKYFETREIKLSKYSNIDSVGRKKISNILAGIANDDSMKNFDSATLALYLRGAGIKQTKKQTHLINPFHSNM